MSKREHTSSYSGPSSSAWGAWYHEHYQALVRGTARRFTRGDPHVAADIVSDAVARSAASLHNTQNPLEGQALASYVQRTVTRAGIDHVEAPTRVREVPTSDDDASFRNLVDPATDVEKVLNPPVAAFIEQHAGYFAEVVKLHVEGKSNVEIAAQLGIPPATVRGQLSRGKALLRRARHHWTGEEDPESSPAAEELNSEPEPDPRARRRARLRDVASRVEAGTINVHDIAASTGMDTAVVADQLGVDHPSSETSAAGTERDHPSGPQRTLEEIYGSAFAIAGLDEPDVPLSARNTARRAQLPTPKIRRRSK